MSEDQNVNLRMQVDENTRIPLKFFGTIMGLVIVGVLWGARLEAKTFYSAQQIEELRATKSSDSEKLNAILAHHTGKTSEEIDVDTERDNFMSAEQSVAYGLIDRVITSRTEAV